MSPIAISAIVFGCIFAGAMLGLVLRILLPERHLSADTKDVVKLAMGLIGTMAALLLGLLVASAKASYDTRRSELIQMSANFVLLDRVLALYGPETKEDREMLRHSVAALHDRLWSNDNNESNKLDPAMARAEVFYDRIQELPAQNESQRTLKAEALSMAINLGQMRWLLFEQTGSSISMPFLTVVVLWLSIIFASFGLFAPRNMTAVISLLLAAMSVSAAIFLILELDQPFEGLIRISDAPVRSALAHLGK